MLELRLKHDGNGVLRPASRHDFDLLTNAGFVSGETVVARLLRRRSAKQNRYFHALIEAAYDNQRSGPQFPTWRHLKGWLLIQAGHCDTIQFAAGAMTPAVTVALRRQFDSVDFSTDGKSIFMKVAKSVRFNVADSEEMGALVDRVVDIICSEIVPGMTADELKTMARTNAR